MKALFQNERGSAYIITFVFILFFFVIINGLIMNSASLSQSSDTELMRLKMKYSLESAAVIAIEKVRSGYNWNNTLTGDLVGFTYIVTKSTETTSSITLSISITKHHNKMDYLRKADVIIDKSTFNIVGWH